jgi:hypothetical protein
MSIIAMQSTGDRFGIIGKIILFVVGLAVFLAIGFVAGIACIVVGPCLLIIAFFAWLFGATWAGPVAGAGAGASVIGFFYWLIFIAPGR